MPPRLLLVAIAVGMASGAAAALVLSEVREERGGPLVLETGYQHTPGAPISVHLTNVSDAELPLGHLEISGLAGMPVYARELPGHLESGESATISWDQVGSDGEPVFAGIYRVRAGDPPASAVIEISEAGLRGD